jgi:ATP-dependent RNA circularization protein (DNA/RNA ligase family)
MGRKCYTTKRTEDFIEGDVLPDEPIIIIISEVPSKR